jgi:hypothetical protein
MIESLVLHQPKTKILTGLILSLIGIIVMITIEKKGEYNYADLEFAFTSENAIKILSHWKCEEKIIYSFIAGLHFFLTITYTFTICLALKYLIKSNIVNYLINAQLFSSFIYFIMNILVSYEILYGIEINSIIPQIIGYSLIIFITTIVTNVLFIIFRCFKN